MIVLGRPCVVCGEGVHEKARARSCAACGVQFHRACAEGDSAKKTCPSCHKDLSRERRKAAEAAEHEARSTIDRGRNVLWGATAVALGVQGLLNVLLVMYGGEGQLMRSVVRMALSVLLFAAMHGGSAGAAKVAITLFAVGGIGATALGIFAMNENPVLANLGTTLGIFYLALAATMGFSQDFWRYLEHVRAEREGRSSG